MCHLEFRRRLTKENDKKLAFDACMEFKFDPMNLTDKIREKIIELKRKMVLKAKQHEVRLRMILLKLLREYKRQRVIDRERVKRYDYKVRKDEKIVRGLDVRGYQMTLVC